MVVTTEASIDLAHPPQRVFDSVIAPESLSQVLKGYGPIPAVVRVEVAEGDGVSEGSRRIVVMADGMRIDELMLEVRPPHYFRYRTRNFGLPFSLLVREGRGQFRFQPRDQGTHLEWRYEYDVTSPLAYPATLIVIGFFFNRAMRRCLANFQSLLDAAAS